MAKLLAVVLQAVGLTSEKFRKIGRSTRHKHKTIFQFEESNVSQDNLSIFYYFFFTNTLAKLLTQG